MPLKVHLSGTVTVEVTTRCNCGAKEGEKAKKKRRREVHEIDLTLICGEGEFADGREVIDATSDPKP